MTCWLLRLIVQENQNVLREIAQAIFKSSVTPLEWQVAEEDFREEQTLMAQLVHMLINKDVEQMFQVRPFSFKFNSVQYWSHLTCEQLYSR